MTSEKKSRLKFSNVVKDAIYIGTYPTRKIEEVLDYIKTHTKIAGTNPKWDSHAISVFLTLLFLSLGVYFYAKHQNIPKEASLMIFIFVFACLLWITEAIPLFATSLLIIGLQVLLLANPGNWPNLGFENPENQQDFKHYFQPLAEPVIYLFLGGFILAQACVKRGVDQTLATWMIRYFGSTPIQLIIGIMVFTALFSMWMSNTATTAMMLTLLGPILSQMSDEKKFQKALILSVPFAANIGGMGTPIGSPPNAIALGFLQNKGLNIGFTDWMLIAIPICIVLLAFTVFLLITIFPPKSKKLSLSIETADLDPKKVFVMSIFSITVLLWMTEKIHGLPTSVVALLPAVVFSVTGLIKKNDINSLEWNVLILIAGGIALGRGMSDTGLDRMVLQFLPENRNILLASLMAATLLLSTVISNTAAANLLIPIGISAAFAFGQSDVVFAKELAFSIALSASLAMALPVSTPPNALAYASGMLKSQDFIKLGIIIGFIGLLTVYLLSIFLFPILS
ncbi:MAG: SLC13 family permease [Thermaurantimonas sp.]|uniref:SLC13 family permease n=1 Tax=Thermaurantimonas sp. TaxID=2681568 RepID=UPI00391C704D